MTEARALALDDDAPRERPDVHEVVFEDAGDLGISVAVDGDGAVVVNKLLQLRGYGELSCPTLHAGDVLVTIDDQSITEMSFADVMLKLHATIATRPTRLEFLSVDRFATADSAVAKWQQRQSVAARTEDPRLREGEFEVSFEPLQPTGLRFTESYIMTTPLKLAHVETPVSATSDASLVNTLLVRVGDDSVLGAPVDDVMALLYDSESFPKTLWLAHVDRLQQDYHVITLSSREQLKWFCFVPVEMMMEVAVVSYAALATTPDATETRQKTRRRTRSDGICEHQYLMAINGFPTLRVSSSSSSFSDDDKSMADDDSVTAVVNNALDSLLGQQRTLRFRDLKAYRREFLAHAPLSPWRRRRLSRSRSRTSTSTSDSSRPSSPVSNAEATPSPPHHWMPSPATPSMAFEGIIMEHKPLPFYQLLKDQAVHDHRVGVVAETVDVGSPRPRIKRYNGLANCEGVRSFAPIVSDDIKCVVVPDNRRPVGIQLETDVAETGRPVFKAFLRSDGPAMVSRRVHVGDRLVSVNGFAVDDIPTDVLVRILHGDESSLTSSEFSTPTESSTSRPRSLFEPPRRRVLQLERRDGAMASNGLLNHAMKFLALSKARLALWKSSQTNTRTSLVK